MYGPGGTAPPKSSRKGNTKLAKLMAKYNSHESGDTTPTPTDANSSKPWLKEFHQYLNGHDEVPSEMTVVQWWGVRR